MSGLKLGGSRMVNTCHMGSRGKKDRLCDLFQQGMSLAYQTVKNNKSIYFNHGKRVEMPSVCENSFSSSDHGKWHVYSDLSQEL